MRRELRFPIIAALLAATAALTACTSANSATPLPPTSASSTAPDRAPQASPAGSSTGSAPAPSTTPSVPTTEMSSNGELVIKAFDYGYSGVPAQIEHGTKLTIVNISASVHHEIVVHRLPDGETRPVKQIMGREISEEPALAGEPVAVRVQLAQKAEVITPVGDGTISQPGRYVIYCKIPVVDGANEPHYKRGMFAEFSVI